MDAVAVDEGIKQTQYLTFHVAGEEYAIGVLQVKEIIEYDTLTEVPQTPPSVRGVINLRGSVVPVVDLAAKFDLPEIQVTKQTCIVIVEVKLESEPAVMGVMVDEVQQVIELKPEDIMEPPAFGTRVHVDYLQGMGKAGKKFTLILDIDKLLSTEELSAFASLGNTKEEEEEAELALPDGEPASAREEAVVAP